MSGASFSVGMQYRAGVAAALEALDQRVVLGRRIVISTHDDQCDEQLAIDVARSLADTLQPAVVIGHSCSGAAIAGAPVYANARILQIAPASTASRLTELGIATLFRMIGRDSLQGSAAASRIAQQHRGARIGIMHFPGTYSRELAAEVLDHLRRQRIEPSKVIVGLDRANSYAEPILAFMDADIDLVYLAGGGLDGGLFVRQSRLLGASFEIMGSDTLTSDVFLDTAGEAADGVVFTFPTPVTPASMHDNEVALPTESEGYTLLAKAAVEVWLEGVQRAASLDAQAVAKAIRAAPIKTAIGRVSFDEKGDIVTEHAPFSWYRWNGGKRVAQR